MHNNYYFLRHLSAELANRIIGFTLVSCFSQNKDELVIELNDGKISFFIKTSLQPEFQCISFPRSYNRAKKNSVDLFNPLVMNKVISIRQFSNERSFALLLENENALVFKMHSARANIVWFAAERVQEIFRNNFHADLELRMNELDRSIDWSYECFLQNQSNLQSVYLTFGKSVWSFLREHNFDELDPEKRWRLLQETRTRLEKPDYHLLEKEGAFVFSLLPSGDTVKTFTDPMEAINEFFIRRVSTAAFQKEKLHLLAHVQGKLKQGVSFLEKTNQKLIALKGDNHYQQWADLIMANLNTISPGRENIEVENFYDDQRPVLIKLRKELSPQKNAEAYYRKSKNRAIEINIIKESIARKEKEMQQLGDWHLSLQMADDLSSIKRISDILLKQSPDKQVKQSKPYHEFEFKGFNIWVGKNAIANDTLTLKYSFKEDLWLHAKDVAGSHVLIKFQAGKPFPKEVIERAAGLAAYYSKRKNESLCPVAVTPKKFVRKRKGDPAGAVVVEREEVILVEPRE